jgi:hypothetical protein
MENINPNTADKVEMMQEDRFWEIIEKSKAKGKGDYELQQEMLFNELTKLDPKEVLAFESRFNDYDTKAYTWDLWAAAYIMDGGCSDDGFMDFRGWLIAQGKEVFMNALKDPETLIAIDHDMDEDDWEGIAYVAMDAYEQMTGQEMPISEDETEGEDVAGTEWEEEDLPAKFPKLWAKWGLHDEE